MGKKAQTKRLPSEINWLRSNGRNISHIDFFNFFKSYNTRRAQARFLAVVDFVEDEDLKKKLVDDYNEWRSKKISRDFWKQRNEQVSQLSTENSPPPQQNENGSSSRTTTTTTTTTTIVESVEIISLEDAKAIIAENMTLVNNHNKYSNSLSQFKSDIFKSLETSLTYESHLQQLLALSNILYIEKNSFYPGLQNYFEEPIKTIRQTMYDSFGFNQLHRKFPMDVMMTLITITSDINRGSVSRIQAESKILSLINDSTDKIMIRLLQLIKSMVESLPFINQKKESKEFELCTRYLQPCFQKLFDCDEDQFTFKWLNTSCFSDTDVDPNQNRPDGLIENDHKAIGYIEVKSIKHVKNHKKINLDLHRLCTFSKAGAAKYNLKHMFQIMAVGTNVQFNISEAMDDILMVLELDCIRFPLSLDELPQLVPYLDRLYNVVEVIHHLCYTSNTFTISNSFKPALDAKVIKAIMEKSTDRTRENPFYHPHH
ncbi:hypothetical protein RMCBS344292_00556 [Rhizopus microsporus]|nr:hypothetical protein RMCBS344292_00556 [Rhizopus microsporus]